MVKLQVNKDLKKIPEDCLTGVIFGLDMAKEDRCLIEKWIGEGSFSPKLYEAIKLEDKIGLIIIPLS